MAIYRVLKEPDLHLPALIAALNGWVDAGDAGTTAASYMASDGEIIVEFDSDALVDYRARRPTLDINDGVLTRMGWHELNIRHVRADNRDLLVLTGPEPDYRWRDFQTAIVEVALRLGVAESVCLGSIGAMVPHTRSTPILVTGKARGSLESDMPLPAEHMQVPASALNIIEIALAEQGIPSVGIWAQVPHYVHGTYFPGALALVERAAGYLGVRLPLNSLVDLAREERARLDTVVASRPEASAYLDQLESTGPVPPLPPGEDIADELERFLREATGDSRNPFEDPGDETP
ncbi:MAG TPA: PAC2 family protein [Actinomycetota bacterium]|nr:PAC2 family protein [Actinomycetota bacterium]